VSETPNMDRENPAGFDPDEDLFAFGDKTLVTPFESEETEDLEEIFATFQAQEAETSAQAAAAPPPPKAEASHPATPPARALEAPPAPAHAGARAPATRAETLVREPSPAAPRAIETTSVPSGERSRRKTILAGASLAILAAVVLVNGLVALITLRTAADLHANLARHDTLAERGVGEPSHAPEAGRPWRGSAPEVREESEAGPLPLVPPDPEQHPVFERARQEIEHGEYAAARRRLYALLAVIDRLEPSSREEIEARTHYFLARAFHLEAVARMEDEP